IGASLGKTEKELRSATKGRGRMLRFLLANTLGVVLERLPGGRDYQNGADSGPAASVLRVLRADTWRHFYR
ncbi:hypothetical protein, partial [Sinorhizobium medicae]|uniref:hypothetical protein n=1 Tax=Sinorhizobium medicae TaxID=110321 RepID=UPI001AECD5B1